MTRWSARLRSAAFRQSTIRIRHPLTSEQFDMRSIAGAVLVLMFSLIGTPVRSQVNLDAAVETFVRIVEKGEFGERAVGLTRWNRPIAVAIAGRPTADQSAVVEGHLGRLRQASNLQISLTAPVSRPRSHDVVPAPIDVADPLGVFQVIYHLPANGWATYLVHGRGDEIFVWRSDLLLMFADQPAAIQIARILRVDNGLLRAVTTGLSPCFAFFFTEPSSHEIKYGIVVLRTDVPEWTRRRCLHEEMTQVMGLRNDVKGSEITLFDDMPARKRTDLTPYDWMFLEVLYDKRMKPGLAGAELRRVARELLAERLARRE